MKKKIVILLGVVFALVLSFALTACGKVALKLTFKVDGEVYQTISTSGNEVISMPENPTKDGFIFDGWFWDEGTWQKPFTANSFLDTPLSSDMSVYAKFSVDATPIGTEIKAEGFEKNDSVYYTKVSNTTETFSFIGKIKVADGAIWRVFTNVACTAEVPSRTKEVSVGDNKFYILVTNGNDVNSYSFVVRRRPIHTVTYRTNSGSYITSQRVEEDSYATDFTPTCTGYTFKAWNYDFTQPIVGDTTITASFDVVTYNIEYDLAGGEFEGAYVKTYTAETPTFALATPVKRGYNFLGWYDGETKVEKITRWSIGDRSFTAKWCIATYAIHYSVYGENNENNPKTYTMFDEVEFLDPSYINGDFVEWQDQNGNKITKIERNSVGDISIKAVYDLYDVQLSLNDDDTFTVVGKQTEGNVVNIKSEYKGKKVTSIGSGAFYNCSSLTSITVPDSVTSIGDYAFSGCSSLTNITIPNSVMSIGIYVFDNCRSLTNVKISDGVMSIGRGMFYNCSSLKSITIPNSVTSIEYQAFSGCSSLKSITIPNSVESVGSSAFSGCSNLKTIYCEAESKPSGWDGGWQYTCYANVVWGYKG